MNFAIFGDKNARADVVESQPIFLVNHSEVSLGRSRSNVDRVLRMGTVSENTQRIARPQVLCGLNHTLNTGEMSNLEDRAKHHLRILHPKWSNSSRVTYEG